MESVALLTCMAGQQTSLPDAEHSSSVLEQRLSLAILRDNSTALDWLPSKQARDTDEDGGNEQDAGDDKGEDPLEGNDSGLELMKADGCTEVSTDT